MMSETHEGKDGEGGALQIVEALQRKVSRLAIEIEDLSAALSAEKLVVLKLYMMINAADPVIAAAVAEDLEDLADELTSPMSRASAMSKAKSQRDVAMIDKRQDAIAERFRSVAGQIRTAQKFGKFEVVDGGKSDAGCAGDLDS